MVALVAGEKDSWPKPVQLKSEATTIAATFSRWKPYIEDDEEIGW
jgi:hypothetical protein